MNERRQRLLRHLAHAARLGVTGLVSRFVTPSLGFARKPARDMLTALGPLDPATTMMVGDDPFSDAPFAAACGLPCSIVDRFGRYGSLTLDARVVATLSEILV